MKYSIHMVGTTHFDPVWLWTWDEAMASIRSTFRSALDRMKEAFKLSYIQKIHAGRYEALA